MWLIKIIAVTLIVLKVFTSAVGWTIISLWLTANWWEIILLSLGTISIVLTVAVYLILVGCRDKDLKPSVAKRLILLPVILGSIFVQITCQIIATVLILTAVITGRILRIPMTDSN